MLTHLNVVNFATVDSLELEPGKGLTVITGETGAGKSVIIDALGLALGERADSAVVRPDAERAEVQATFDLRDNPAARAWLAERELDDGDDCLSNCRLAHCGDGVVQVGLEECDDGNIENTDACLNSCTLAACGDGFLRTGRHWTDRVYRARRDREGNEGG